MRIYNWFLSFLLLFTATTATAQDLSMDCTQICDSPTWRILVPYGQLELERVGDDVRVTVYAPDIREGGPIEVWTALMPAAPGDGTNPDPEWLASQPSLEVNLEWNRSTSDLIYHPGGEVREVRSAGGPGLARVGRTTPTVSCDCASTRRRQFEQREQLAANWRVEWDVTPTPGGLWRVEAECTEAQLNMQAALNNSTFPTLWGQPSGSTTWYRLNRTPVDRRLTITNLDGSVVEGGDQIVASATGWTYRTLDCPPPALRDLASR